MKPPIRVLVVDDSAVMRKLIPQAIQKDDENKVLPLLGARTLGFMGAPSCQGPMLAAAACT